MRKPAFLLKTKLGTSESLFSHDERQYEPGSQKICLRHFRPGAIQTSLCSHRKIKIKKLCLTSRFETDNISSVELLLRHNE